MKLHRGPLSSALDCILSLSFMSSAQDSVFFSSSHLPVQPAHPPLSLRAFGNTSWGVLRAKLSGPDSLLLLGETQFTRESGSPRQMARLMFCQGSKSLFQSHQKEDSTTLMWIKASWSVPASLGFLPVTIAAAVSQPGVQIITPDSSISSEELTFQQTDWQTTGIDWYFCCLAVWWSLRGYMGTFDFPKEVKSWSL